MGFCSIFRRNNLNVLPTCQWGKYLPRSPSEVPESPDDVTVYRKNASKAKSSQTPQSPANQSSSNNHQARSVPPSRTTSSNGVAVARSGNLKSKSESKKPTTSKKPVIEISDDDDSESLERGVALASPEKGVDSRRVAKVSKNLYIFF